MPAERVAMRQVREALGADAVILETARTDTGVEISAAMDASGDDIAASRPSRNQASRMPAAPDEGPAIRIDAGSAGYGGWYQPPRAPKNVTR